MAQSTQYGGGLVDPELVDRHIQVIRERGANPDDYIEQIKGESGTLALALTEAKDAGAFEGEEATEAKAQYERRILGLEDRTNNPGRFFGNPEGERADIIDPRPAAHNPLESRLYAEDEIQRVGQDEPEAVVRARAAREAALAPGKLEDRQGAVPSDVEDINRGTSDGKGKVRPGGNTSSDGEGPHDDPFADDDTSAAGASDATPSPSKVPPRRNQGGNKSTTSNA